MKLRQQLGVVGSIVRTGARIASGVDARRTPQCLDAEARVVSKDRTFALSAVVQRFLAGVGFKRSSVLDAGGQVGDGGNRFNRYSTVAGRLPEFPKLSRVGRSQVQWRVTSNE